MELNSPYGINITQATLKNKDYRHVLYTDDGFQLVLMNLKPLQDIGMETHSDTTQFFYIVEGLCLSYVNDIKTLTLPGEVLIVPKGNSHNIINPSKKNRLKLYTIYTPPEHKAGTIQRTKPLQH